MYRIALLTDKKQDSESYVRVIKDYCASRSQFPLVERYLEQELFFKEIQKNVPDIVFLTLPGVAGLNAAEHLHSLFPRCGIIWCSDLDFSLHAFRLRIVYFFMEPIEEQKIREGLTAWFETQIRIKKQ